MTPCIRFWKSTFSPPRSNKDEGTFRNFSARIELSYRLGLLHPLLYHDLHIIRNVRNKFAHKSVGINFETPEVAAFTRKLAVAGAFDQLVLARAKEQPELVSLCNQNSRDRFIVSGAFMLHGLAAVREQVKQVTVSTGMLLTNRSEDVQAHWV